MKDKQQDIKLARHSLSHILAMAVLDMFPEAKLGIGPATDEGFYYDFDLPRSLIPEDLPLLEKKMREVISKNLNFEKNEVSADEALNRLRKSDEVYKCELVEDLRREGKAKVTLYKTGEFVDLCEGPHVKSTAELRGVGFKLDKIAGAYWRGDEKNKMLQRIYGLAFTGKPDLDKYLHDREEAEKRDHKKLGRDLELFIFDETAPGMPYWLPKGLRVYNTLVEFWRREHEARGYQEIKTPLLNKKELYIKSGHWDHYRKDMFLIKTEEKEVYGVKPMNCPNAIVVYQLRPRSYREFPLRYSDCDTLHRAELSGTLNGLFRARMFSQDDAHVFICENQIKEEYREILGIVADFYEKFDLDYSFRLGTRPGKFMGDKGVWDKAEETLKEILEKSGKHYTVEEGDGAFYGPKIDILMKDSLGRKWQMGTIQLDFQLPLSFGLKYTDRDGREKMPVIIHRVVYGSLERFIGILIEHYGGAFPVWLAPIQSIILPISDKHLTYAKEITQKLKMAGVRAETDGRSETISKKIREAQLQKIPYMLIVGDKEIKLNKISVRELTKGDRGQIALKALVKEIKSF